MNLRVIGCEGSRLEESRLVTMLLGHRVMLDAGSACSVPPRIQDGLDMVLLTHAHLDHLLELGFLLDNITGFRNRPLTVMGSRACIATIREHYMNDRLWPDFSRISSGGCPVLEYREMPDLEWFELPGEIMAMSVPVNHPAGARGFIFKSGNSAMVYSGDTGPNEALWRRAREVPRLSMAWVECSFPDRLRDLAIASDHLCPSLAREQMAILNRPDVPGYAFHLKKRLRTETVAELGHDFLIPANGDSYLLGGQ